MTNLIPLDDAAQNGREVHSDAVWDYARRDYLDGESAAQVCARYGIARSTFWNHAAAGGWRRRDQPPTDLPPVEVEGDPDQRLEHWDLVGIVNERLNKAVLSGRASEVSSWLRVLEQLDKPTRELIEFCREERAWQERRRTAHPDSSDSAPAETPVRRGASDSSDTSDRGAMSPDGPPRSC